MQLFQVPCQVFTQILEDLLSIEDVQRVSQVSWKTLASAQCYAAVMNFAWPRLELGLGKGKTSLRHWRPVYEACKAIATQKSTGSGNGDLRRLNRLISFKHTRFTRDPDTYFPMPWQFRAGSVEPLLRFLWQECATETVYTHKHISAATYVEVLGGGRFGCPTTNNIFAGNQVTKYIPSGLPFWPAFPGQPLLKPEFQPMQVCKNRPCKKENLWLSLPWMPFIVNPAGLMSS